MRGIQIYNEIGRLCRVLVHRPGNETHNHAEDDFEQVFFLYVPGASALMWTRRSKSIAR